MGKLEDIIKDEIIRLAKREMRARFAPLRRDVQSLKVMASQLRKSVASLQRVMSQQQRQISPKPLPEVTPEDLKTARFSPRLIKSIRKHLGVSMREMAKLTGVTVGAIFKWEKGNFEPKDDKKKTLVGLRKLGRHGARTLLEEKKDKAAPEKKPGIGKKRSRRKVSRKYGL